MNSHIDDTDETYGYWEPLHYLLYNKGMQTWEYSPYYAIRSYAFIFPMFVFSEAIRRLFGLKKIILFHTCKLALGLLYGYSFMQLIRSIKKTFNGDMFRYTFIFLSFSAGSRAASVAYLPSATSMTILTFVLMAYIKGEFRKAIFFGCIVVLCTGWPFVGVLLLPLGLVMLLIEYKAKNFAAVMKLCMFGIIAAMMTFITATAVDRYYYGKWTSPTINILTYNAGSNKDLLYGVEPASYYIKNLMLNMGFAPIIVLLSILIKCIAWCCALSDGYESGVKKLGIYVSALLWLGVLFSREHKEERFLYPVYPYMAFIAADTIESTYHILNTIISRVLRSVSNKEDVQYSEKRSDKKISNLRLFLWFIISLSSGAIFLSRVYSNSVNYGGYKRLWSEVYTEIDKDNVPNRSLELIVCTGSEWYYFPSHFFLPSTSHLRFVSDGFNGQLPHHFSSFQGTSAIPTLPFNDDNVGDDRVYADISNCDYLVILSRGDNHDHLELLKYELVKSMEVLDIAASTSSIARALYIPYYSPSKNKFRNYEFYRRRVESNLDRI